MSLPTSEKFWVKVERYIIFSLLFLWSGFQLLLPKAIILESIKVRSIHLAFGIALVFLIFPFRRKKGNEPTEKKESGSGKALFFINCTLAALASFSALYVMIAWEELAGRSGAPLPRDIAISIVLIILLLEAARRVLGPALSIITVIFAAYAFLGPYMPGDFAFKGCSLEKFIDKTALSRSGIYGIPLDVSATTVFLFVLFGAMLNKFGAGHFFNEAAISLLGRFKGGPAKAAVVSSGLTGLVSGSSIANVVTTGTFTIPMMKKVGYPAETAAATEVAASTNGQLMPPIMGAAAFIIAEYLAIDYMSVVKAAILPAVVSYLALFYITHLEASKLKMKGLPPSDIPEFRKVMRKGFYFLIPIFVLIFELMYLRHTPNLAAFNAIIILGATALVKKIIDAISNRSSVNAAIFDTLRLFASGMVSGAKNMIPVAIATATAGIIVGIVTTGIGSMVVNIVENISCGNIVLLLLITAIASLILGMGLPTTATYIVMASITVPVIITLSAKFDMNPIPAIAAHLFCFYFGILADDTPPVGLAAYAAAAIAKANPVITGIRGFLYDLRTAVIPFMFVFNPELLLYRISSLWQVALVFTTASLGALAFTNATQGWFIVKNKLFELPLFLASSLILFYPALPAKIFNLGFEHRYWMYIPGLLFYLGAYISQKIRIRRQFAL